MLQTLYDKLGVTKQDGTTFVTIPAGVLVALVLLIIVLLLILWSIKRRSTPHLRLEERGELDELIPSLAGLSHGDIVEGNSIQLLHNGDGFFPEIMKALRAAKESIHVEAFLCKKGEVVDEISSVLAQKAAEGVDVRFLIDGSGGRKIGRDNIKKLRKAGAQIRKFHPVRLSNLGRLNNRDHRKIIVIDGGMAFVGGHCLVDDWLGDAQDKKHFRDISIKIEGPVVHRIQSAFTENWIEETGEVPAGEKFFPAPKRCGESKAHVAYTTPANSSSSVKVLHYVAIAAAKKRILIQNPYFLPDPEAIELLLKAVERGVEVRVMLPSANASDSPMVQHASHHHFGTLLKGGVKIYEYGRTLLHQKVMTIDGEWSAVGSTNFDDRSFEVNDEITIGIWDPEIARQLEETFEADLKHSKECFFDEWKKRPVGHKLKDFGFYLLNEQL